MSDEQDDDNDGGLYDDVDDVKLAANPTTTTTTSDSTVNNFSSSKMQHYRLPRDHPKSLIDQLGELQSTVQKLEAENVTLKRNMGTLFRTATAELARKDRQLQDLRRELVEASQHQQTQPP